MIYIWNVYILLLNDIQHVYVCTCSFSEYMYISCNWKLMHFKYKFIVRRLRYIQHYTGSPANKIVMITSIQFFNFWYHLVCAYYLSTLVIFESTNTFSWKLVWMLCYLSLFYFLYLQNKNSSCVSLWCRNNLAPWVSPRNFCVMIKVFVPHKFNITTYKCLIIQVLQFCAGVWCHTTY